MCVWIYIYIYFHDICLYFIYIYVYIHTIYIYKIYIKKIYVKYVYIYICIQSILVFDTMQVLYWPVLGLIQFCSFVNKCKYIGWLFNWKCKLSYRVRSNIANYFKYNYFWDGDVIDNVTLRNSHGFLLKTHCWRRGWWYHVPHSSYSYSASVTLWRQLQTRFVPCESSDQCTNMCSDSIVFLLLYLKCMCRWESMRTVISWSVIHIDVT